MNLWTRELAGWILLGLGLYVFYCDYQLLTEGNHKVLEGAMLTVIGIFLFRGGIHLLKIAVAARVCVEAERRLRGERTTASGVRPSARVVAGRRSSPLGDKTSLPS